ncbi:MAG: hypothetical protein AB1756_02605 [Acidobacteriota bacterium]
MNTASLILIFSALSTAVFHTLIPDHWLPFVLIGRARNWSIRRTIFISGLSACLHIFLSLLLGLLGMVIGLGTSMAAGETLEKISGILLILFGAIYAYWAFRKGGHFHIGGEMVHVRKHHREAPDAPHPGRDTLHWHKDYALITGELEKSDLYLAMIIGLNPCIIIFPILFAAASYGPVIVSTVIVLYSVSTFLMMMGLTVLGLKWAMKIEMKFFSKYGEILSGILITFMGIVFLFLEL